MFKKKKCRKCEGKISDKYDFCPYCGMAVQDSGEDFGMLGKNDVPNEFDDFSKSMFGGNMFNKMLGSAMKMLEKEMQKEVKRENFPRANFQMFINGKRVNLGRPVCKKREMNKPVKEVQLSSFSEEKSRKFSKLVKENPTTNIRRFSNKIVYEINVPGVKSIKNVSIVKLENSIEIKALAKNKAYLKVIPINLPIIGYILENQKIILELAVRG